MYDFVKKKLYSDLLDLILQHEACTLTVVNQYSFQKWFAGGKLRVEIFLLKILKIQTREKCLTAKSSI